MADNITTSKNNNKIACLLTSYLKQLLHDWGNKQQQPIGGGGEAEGSSVLKTNGTSEHPEVEIHFSQRQPSITHYHHNHISGGGHQRDEGGGGGGVCGPGGGIISRESFDAVFARLRENGLTAVSAFGDDHGRDGRDGRDGRGGGGDDGHHILRIFMEGDPNARWEIWGLDLVEEYCLTNDINSVMEKIDRQNAHINCEKERESNSRRVKYTRKTFPHSNSSSSGPPGNGKSGGGGGVEQYVVAVDEYHYRLSYRVEKVTEGTRSSNADTENRLQGMATTGSGWKGTKKKFRYLSRVRYGRRDSLPFSVDMTVVKSSDGFRSGGGGGRSVGGGYYYDIHESNLFSNGPTYEIELEMDNALVYAEMVRSELLSGGDAVVSKNKESMYASQLMGKLRRCVHWILQGLQMSSNPIPDSKRKEVLAQYCRLMFSAADADQSTVLRKLNKQSFVGPSSVNLEHAHLRVGGDVGAESGSGIFRTAYCVTEKADGERRLLFIHEDQGVYFMDNLLNVSFSGYYCDKKELVNTLLDGEFISQKKRSEGRVFLAFDVYMKSAEWKFHLPFVDAHVQRRTKEYSRLMLLQYVVENATSSLFRSHDAVAADNTRGRRCYTDVTLEIQTKEFLYKIEENTGHGGDAARRCSMLGFCRTILHSRTYEYDIDGLVFTPLHFAVGQGAPVSNNDKRDNPPNYRDIFKKEWKWLLKWKPAAKNTIDFLVEIPAVPHVMPGGAQRFVTIELYCGYNEQKYGRVNPFDDMIYGYGCSGNGGGSEGVAVAYKPVFFTPTNPYDRSACFCNVLVESSDMTDLLVLRTEENEVMESRSIIEFRYDHSRTGYWKWIPLRVRWDKTREYRSGLKSFGNDYLVANAIWRTIHDPVTDEMIAGYAGKEGGGEEEQKHNQSDFSSVETPHKTDMYYLRENSAVVDMETTRALRDFHNLCVKRKLIECASVWRRKRRPAQAVAVVITDAPVVPDLSASTVSLIDYAVGKAGDLAKWMNAGIDFVLGIDICEDNLWNKYDGACVRYLDMERRGLHTNNTTNNKLACMFLRGDSSLNVLDKSAFTSSELEKEIAEVIFDEKAFELTASQLKDGNLRKMAEVEKLRGHGRLGFDISSMQFSIHYMMKDPMTLHGFLRNVSECTKVNGIFVGTCLDGKKVFRLLKKRKDGVLRWFVRDKLVYEIRRRDKHHHATTPQSPAAAAPPAKSWLRQDNWMSLGYSVDVFVDTINHPIEEYLVNFDFLEKVMFAYGFVKLKQTELVEMGFPSNCNSCGSFEELFDATSADAVDYMGRAFLMSEEEKKISFLNRYFMFRKVRDVKLGDNPQFPCNATSAAAAAASTKTPLAVAVMESDNRRQKFTKVAKVLIAPEIYRPIEVNTGGGGKEGREA